MTLNSKSYECACGVKTNDSFLFRSHLHWCEVND